MGKEISEEPVSNPHIMVIPLPFQGHISPAMQFSKRLASKGLRVTLIVTKNTIKPTEAKSSPINIEYISYDYDEGFTPKSAEEYMAHIERKVAENLPVLLDKQKSCGYPVTALVQDSMMPRTVDLGHGLGLKVALFFTQACAVCAIYYHVHQGRIEVPLEEGCTISLPCIPELEIHEMPSDLFDGLYPGSSTLLANQFLNIHKADWIFFNTFDALENELAKWLSNQWPIKTIGPSIPSMYLDKRLPDDKDYGLSLFQPDAQSCVKWLDTKPNGSVIYVSFGSLANLGQDHMDELANGLLHSNSNFLWVVRESEQSKLPNNFISKAAEKGLVVGWCPQLEVLAHKAVGSFMTHCGWNSVLEALSLGVPMLAMPQWTDQTTNAKYVVDVWKTGVRVKGRDKGIVTREEIAGFVNDVMEGEKGEELRANALRWKELAVEAMDEGGSSDKNIDEFVSNLIFG